MVLPELVPVVESFQREHDLEVDGMFGPKTRAKAAELIRGSEMTLVPPKGRVGVEDLFGSPGAPGSIQGLQFERKNIISISVPGIPHVTRVHKALAPTFSAAFAELATKFPDFPVHSAWCYIHRYMRNDASTPLSYHSYGIAFDLNPQQNFTRSYPRRNGPKPFSRAWKRVWGDAGAVTPEIVELFKSYGFAWGGDWTSFVDPMHFEYKKA